MIRTIKFFCAFLFLSLISCQTNTNSENKFDHFNIQRGTNIAHFLSQSEQRGVARESFFTRNDVETIASLGFDHIRLPIDEEQMWDENLNRHTEAFKLMNNVITWCNEEGIRVIVDLHILRSHHFNKDKKPLWTERVEQERFLNLWRDLSDDLKDYPVGQVAYELMNEAVADDPDQWNDLLNEAVEVIRELEPERTIVIGSNMWQSASTFHELRIPENDTNILLSFHFYSPFALTHHEASWTGIKDYHGPVHYPGEVIEEKDLEELPEDLQEQMRGAAGYYTKDTLKSMMQEPLEYAKEHKLPLYCGEFGVYNPAPRDDGLRWYNDMINVLEEQGIAWANWCYKGGFGIYEEDGKIDEELMKRFFQNAD